MRAIVISASSDIGTDLCLRWKNRGWDVHGTYRTRSAKTGELERKGIPLVPCDLSDRESVGDACDALVKSCPSWDVLVLCPGAQEPVGAFASGVFDEWEDSVGVNFTAQMRIVHKMLPSRNPGAKHGPCVLLFAGGGTNNAPVNYSAYIISKIALMKMCELLDAEIPDTRFTILGPGWVKTKIHEATLNAPEKAGANYVRTVEKLASDECTPMEQVLACCDWVVNAPRNIVGGRNFSVVFDKWGTEELDSKLIMESNHFKLRRFGNE